MIVPGAMHAAALACGQLTRGVNRRSAALAEVIMSRRSFAASNIGAISPLRSVILSGVMDAQDFLKMQKTTLTVTSLLAPSDDPAYWHAKSPWERLQAVEILRRLNYGDGQSIARLQRVLAVTQRPSR